MDDPLWLFVEWNDGKTLTRATVPAGVKTGRELAAYLQKGGKIVSDWMEIQPAARFQPRLITVRDPARGVVWETVLARLQENKQ